LEANNASDRERGQTNDARERDRQERPSTPDGKSDGRPMTCKRQAIFENAATHLVLKYIPFFYIPKIKQGIFIPTPIINNQTLMLHKRERGYVNNVHERERRDQQCARERERGKTNNV